MKENTKNLIAAILGALIVGAVWYGCHDDSELMRKLRENEATIDSLEQTNDSLLVDVARSHEREQTLRVRLDSVQVLADTQDREIAANDEEISNLPTYESLPDSRLAPLADSLFVQWAARYGS